MFLKTTISGIKYIVIVFLKLTKCMYWYTNVDAPTETWTHYRMPWRLKNLGESKPKFQTIYTDFEIQLGY